MRINGFELISAFFSFAFSNQDKNIRPYHISLYVFLWNQNNRLKWVEWFKCPLDLGMMGSGINSKHTYYKALKELHEWGLIKYKKGVNDHKSPIIKLEVQKCTSTVPQSEPLPIPLLALQAELLPDTLLGREIKLLTDNLEKVTSNIDSVLNFLGIEEKRNNTTSNQNKNLKELNSHSSDSERVKLATQKIAEFFNISELKQAKHFMSIGNFVRYQEAQNNLDYLSDQFTAYRKFKELNPQYKHNWQNYIGDPEKSYQNGAWNIKNWQEVLKHSKGSKEVSAGSLSESIKRSIELQQQQ